MNDVADTPPAERTDSPRPGTTHPHLARERALKVLFAADVRGVDPRLLLDQVETQRGGLELLDELEPDDEQVAGDAELQLELTRRRRLPLDDYTRDLVAGVAARRPAIDALLEQVADRWAVRRMPAVDRNLLRLAVYELVVQDTPHAVVIDEAVSLAGGFAGEKAHSFVNGVLETIRKRVVAGTIELELTPDPEPEPELVPAPPATGTAAAADATSTPDAAPHAAPDDDEVEVDEAAQEAYDIALDLLGDDDADFDEYDAEVDEVVEPDELDEDLRFDPDGTADELPAELTGADLDDDTGDDTDEGDPLW